MVFWMIQCFKRIGWVKDSITHAQTSVSFLMNRPFEGIVWMNDSMTRLIKPRITLHLCSLSTNQYNLFKTLFFNQSKHIEIFIQELCIYKTITFYDSSLVIKKKSLFFPSHPVAYSRPPGRVSPVENHWSKQCNDMKTFFRGASQEDILGLAISLIFDQFSIL